MKSGSGCQRSRREVLRIVGATAGLTVGSTVVVGTPGNSSSTSVGVRNQPGESLRAKEWNQQAKLAADDGDGEDRFGLSTAVSEDGTTSLVAAYGDEDPNGQAAGSVYVFDGSGGEWTQQAKLLPDDGDSTDRFSASVAVSDDGTTAIIGASHDEDSNGRAAGSAYVFERAGGEWTQQAKLAPNDGDEIDLFGGSVAVSGDGTTAIFGVSNDDDPNGEDAGSAYVFDGGSGEWTQQAKLVADDGDGGDQFGYSVAVSDDGTTAIVGAHYDDYQDLRNMGSAYVFDGSGGEWTQQGKLTADDGDENYDFGTSVAVSGDGTLAVVGAPEVEGPNSIQTGALYLFDGSGGEWIQQTKLVRDYGQDDRFGASVAVSSDGTAAITGAPSHGNDDPIDEDAGAAYLYDGSGERWRQEAKLVADDGDNYDSLGGSVSLSGDGTTAIVGASFDEDPNGNEAGSAYVFGTGESGSETTPTTGTGDTTTTIDSGTTESSADRQTSENESDDGGGGGSAPGFGVRTLVAGLTGAGYLLWWNNEEDTEE